jgi:hypothetical protein
MDQIESSDFEIGGASCGLTVQGALGQESSQVEYK